ncbi:SMI1/KNR4 family protein [Bacillus sp. UNC41MFS5]|uniref:SMI1/KNR4 family protein n=1 Tax=Bacillus sp. UNC41MFS5 TaxID=1449046 RepID=UPI00047EDC61|nr:SMI1/KNR4 family protein [Bacillus sp. UNC41MFS5]
MEKFWKEEIESYKLEPLTEKVIKNAEAKLGVTLPKSYLQILKEQNGGFITFNAFPTSKPTVWAENHVQVEHIRGIGEENGILESEYLIKEWDLPSDIVLISGDGHYWVALDYRVGSKNPKVIYIDTESEQTMVLAKSFSMFLKGLYIEDDSSEEEEEYNYGEEIKRNFIKNWTSENITYSLASNKIDIIIPVFNYMIKHPNPKEYVPSIENALFRILYESDEQLREMGALYATHFKRKKILSSETKDKLREILSNDKELNCYAKHI